MPNIPPGSVGLGDGGDFVADVIFLRLTLADLLHFFGLLFGDGEVGGGVGIDVAHLFFFF